MTVSKILSPMHLLVWLGCVSLIIIATVMSTREVTDSADESNALTAISYSADPKKPSYQPDSDINTSDKSIEVNASVASASDANTYVQRLAQRLKKDYGKNIALLPVQAKLYMERLNVLSEYPEEGLALFNQAIALAFPDFQQAILSLLELIETYRQWLVDNDEELASLSEEEYDQLVNEKRQEIFGDQLDGLLYDPDLSADQIAAKKHIQSLDKAYDMDYDERLYQLNTSMYEAFDNTVQFAQLTPVSIADTFFNLRSVQRDLAAMEPSERQERINDTRARLGFTPEELEYFEKRDQKRNARWENGKAYMKARAELIETSSEETLDAALDALREKFFKHEKDTFAKEEASGFFRYTRPRVYGRN